MTLFPFLKLLNNIKNLFIGSLKKMIVFKIINYFL